MLNLHDLLAFVFGAIVGSFLTVCIHRIPRGLDFIKTSSRCGRCGLPIAFFDNVPVLGYLLLRGRCRKCGIAYGSRHVWIELLMGAVAVFLYQRWGITVDGVFFFMLACLLVVISFIDIDFRIIPNSMTLLPWFVGVALAGVFEAYGVAWFVTFWQSVLGSVAGALGLWLVAYIYQVVTGVEGLGLGDVKLMGFFGAFFGIQSVWIAVFVGSLLGAIWGVTGILLQGRSKRTPIPFGPFLCLGLVFFLIEGHVWFMETFL